MILVFPSKMKREKRVAKGSNPKTGVKVQLLYQLIL